MNEVRKRVIGDIVPMMEENEKIELEVKKMQEDIHRVDGIQLEKHHA